jgi:hypothetical protein
MDKTLVFFLTANDRYFIFDKFIDEINKCAKETVDKLFFLIVNSSSDMTYYNHKLSKHSLNFECVLVPCPQSNYLPKVQYAIHYASINNYKYIFKCDNDIIIPAYTLDYIMQHISLLDTTYLTLSPNISTGLPSVEYFIDEAFSPDEALAIRSEFNKCRFNNQPGVFDYRILNTITDKWDYNTFFNELRLLPTFFKGTHPVRHGFGNDLINDLIIKYKDTIFEKKNCSIIADDPPYFANMCFFISTIAYNNLMNREQLIVTGCDDIPLNRYAWKYNLKHGIISHGYAIHIAYGWRWAVNNTKTGDDYVNINCPTKTLIEYEQLFLNRLYS